MINEFGWAWRQTQALIREYDTNVSVRFSGCVGCRVDKLVVKAEFKSDIQKLLETLESKDPRRKPTQ